jgi:hypothetical protein
VGGKELIIKLIQSSELELGLSLEIRRENKLGLSCAKLRLNLAGMLRLPLKNFAFKELNIISGVNILRNYRELFPNAVF